MNKNVILVGCGNMGYAMLKGWLASGTVRPADITVVEPNEALRSRAAETGANVRPSADGIAAGSADLVIIAVKPQVIRDVLPAYRALAPHAVHSERPGQQFPEQAFARRSARHCADP